ncbi:MAG: formylglycine-generating enzyme family protein [Bdellovibrionales bacterium]
MTRDKILGEPQMVKIQGGPFRMGDEAGTDAEKPAHDVFIDPFYMDATPVTNAQFKLFLKECAAWQKTAVIKKYLNTYYLYMWRNEIFYPKQKRDHPVVYVTWFSAAAYCNWRSQKDGLTCCYDENNEFACNFSASGYRLPTEAEYEFASKGGKENNIYPWGNEINKSVANYDNLIGDTTEVGSYPPNGYGLFDMSGNIAQWCQDWFAPDYYRHGAPQNPHGPETGKYRVYRGGAWGTPADFQRCTKRFWLMPENCNPDFGFRCVRRG